MALLRGINVGGRNLIKMTELKTCFEELGFRDVTTYIQSGNVLFRADGGDAKTITRRIEDALSEEFDYDAKVILRSRTQVRKVVNQAPPGWGENSTVRYNVLFLKQPLTPAKVLAAVEPKPDIEGVAAGPGVLYWWVDAKKAARSTYVRLPGKPVYQDVTIRTHGTVTQILKRLDALAHC